MARPKCCRRVAEQPACKIFKPIGVPVTMLDEIILTMDEFEAIRLADFEGLYHEHGAGRMNVSRQTFGRIIEAARSKVARMLIEGLALRIEGGEVEMAEKRAFWCEQCRHKWDIPYGTGRPEECPDCGSTMIFSVGEQRGSRRGYGRCRGRG
jgi:uncharacterized protein